VNSPLSILSAPQRKNVSPQEKRFGRGSCVSCGPSELCYEALHTLPNGIRCNAIRLGDFVAGVPVEVDLDEQVELAVGK
jgi:hypothetical protein